MNILEGKKWAVCGDSFSNGDFKGSDNTDHIFKEGRFAGKNRTYGYLIAERNNMEIQHLAVGGMCIATPSDEEFLNTFTSGLYKTIDKDVDYITLYFGINDSHHRPKSVADDGEIKKGTIHLGTIDDTQIDTFYGAWNTVLDYLIRLHQRIWRVFVEIFVVRRGVVLGAHGLDLVYGHGDGFGTQLGLAHRVHHIDGHRVGDRGPAPRCP